MPRPSEGDSALPLVFDGVSVVRGESRPLDAVSFTLEAGPTSVILGPNGAGKSMTLRVANDLVAPSAGSVRWSGAAGAQAARRRALVFQRPVVLRRSVEANVLYALRLRGIPREERTQRTQRVLAATGLARYATRPARTLSVGEQQRLAIARAWSLEPEVLFLDEPAASLDPGASRALEAAIRAIRSEGTKIVLTTHDLGQARRLADEVLFLDRGRLLEQTPAEAFFDEPRTVEARKFLQGEILG